MREKIEKLIAITMTKLDDKIDTQIQKFRDAFFGAEEEAPQGAEEAVTLIRNTHKERSGEFQARVLALYEKTFADETELDAILAYLDHVQRLEAEFAKLSMTPIGQRLSDLNKTMSESLADMEMAWEKSILSDISPELGRLLGFPASATPEGAEAPVPAVPAEVPPAA